MIDLLQMINGMVDEINDLAEQGYEAMYEYLSDCLDIEYHCNARKELTGCVFTLAIGGPSIYLDAHRGIIRGYWGSDNFERRIDSYAEDMIWQIAEDWWTM